MRKLGDDQFQLEGFAMTNKKLFIALTAFFALSAVQAEAKAPDADAWQQNALFNPGSFVKYREQKGLVTIYDGLAETEVNRFLDTQFDRIENVMFTRVKLTDASGAVRKNADGSAIVQDDGCD
jgi:hypothetical protein